MMETRLFYDIFELSCGFWVIFWFVIHLMVMRVIVPRYKKKTTLGETAFFKKLLPFEKYTPSFFSSSGYSMHLLICIWIFKWAKKSKGSRLFEDIDTAHQVTGHFSKIEIWLVHLDFILLGIAAVHMFLY